MITLTGSKPDITYLASGDARAKSVMSFVGLSSDTKPTDTYKGTTITNGSTFFEMNTSTVYMYDEANTTWHELG
jgi:hypothetical protein